MDDFGLTRWTEEEKEQFSENEHILSEKYK